MQIVSLSCLQFSVSVSALHWKRGSGKDMKNLRKTTKNEWKEYRTERGDDEDERESLSSSLNSVSTKSVIWFRSFFLFSFPSLLFPFHPQSLFCILNAFVMNVPRLRFICFTGRRERGREISSMDSLNAHTELVTVFPSFSWLERLRIRREDRI